MPNQAVHLKEKQANKNPNNKRVKIIEQYPSWIQTQNFLNRAQQICKELYSMTGKSLFQVYKIGSVFENL